MFSTDYSFYKEPFPHIIVKNFVKDEAALKLLKDCSELPEFAEVRQEKPHQRMNFFEKNVNRTLTDGSDILPCKEFSQEFNSSLQKILITFRNHEIQDIAIRIFEPYLKENFLDFEENWKRRLTSYGAYGPGDVPKHLIGWHLDRGNKLIAGFVYFKETGDNSNDGNLQFSAGPDSLIKEIPAEDNLYVVWPNLTYAWHRAIVRFPTKHYRRFLNLTHLSQHPLHKYHDYKTPKVKRIDDTHLYPDKKFGYRKVTLHERKESKASA